MANLPVEIVTEILLRLPVKTLGRFKSVCKPWHFLISSPQFIKTHLRQSSIRRRRELFLTAWHTDSLYIINNIDNENGEESPKLPAPIRFEYPEVACIKVVGLNTLKFLLELPNTFSLLNPTTKEYKMLPDPGSFRRGVQLLGFDYIASADDYKVIKIVTDDIRLGQSTVGKSIARIYSAKANSWKMVGCNFPFSTFSWYRPAHLNGVVHWLVFGGKFPSDYKIVGFNFASEKFNMLPWPKSLKRRNIECLGVLGGCLCLFWQKCDLDCFEMWVMLEYGVRESWTKTITISRCSQSLYIFQMLPVCYLRDTILLRIDETDLVSNDPVKREESLVSPGGCIGEETDIRMEENEGE